MTSRNRPSGDLNAASSRQVIVPEHADAHEVSVLVFLLRQNGKSRNSGGIADGPFNELHCGRGHHPNVINAGRMPRVPAAGAVARAFRPGRTPQSLDEAKAEVVL